jgi:ligand-binding SRPBCC domain-containing protein
MKVHTLKRTQVIPATIEDCWAFFSNPKNLSKITPASLDFRVLSKVPDKIYAGMMIQYRVKPLLGIPVKWVTEITHVREPDYFSEEQRVGPYAMWHHEHFFTKLDGQRVEVRDLVHYALPFSFIGSIAHELLVKQQLETIFKHREKVVTEIFNS